jgi:hypothetical protein
VRLDGTKLTTFATGFNSLGGSTIDGAGKPLRRRQLLRQRSLRHHDHGGHHLQDPERDDAHDGDLGRRQ